MVEKDYEGKAKESEKDKPNALDVYEFLWRGRDFELSHLWHRSVFLAVFLLVIATMYAVYFKDVFICQFASCNQFKGVFGQILVFGFVPILITAIGIIFSELWIMMAKGSKAWYEVYEDSIARISKIDEFWDDKSIKDIYCDKIQGFKFGNLILDCEVERNYCLFSTAGGTFSVSRINIMVGIVFLSVFIGLHIVHIIWAMYLLVHTYKDYLNKFKICDVVFFVLIFLVGLFTWFISRLIKKKVISSYLD